MVLNIKKVQYAWPLKLGLQFQPLFSGCKENLTQVLNTHRHVRSLAHVCTRTHAHTHTVSIPMLIIPSHLVRINGRSLWK